MQGLQYTTGKGGSQGLARRASHYIEAIQRASAMGHLNGGKRSSSCHTFVPQLLQYTLTDQGCM